MAPKPTPRMHTTAPLDDDVQEVLTPVVSDTGDKADMQEVALAALSLGLIYVGSCDEEVGGTIVQRMMESRKCGRMYGGN